MQQIVGEADPGDYRLRAERIYSWVLEHIDNNDDLFSQAAVMLRARAGNRARVLHYMLGLAGVPSRWPWSAAASSDLTPINMADGDTYEHLLVTYEDVSGPVWLFTVERYAPFALSSLRSCAANPRSCSPPARRKTRVPRRPGQRRPAPARLRRHPRARTAAPTSTPSKPCAASAPSPGAASSKHPAPELNQKFEETTSRDSCPAPSLKTLHISGRNKQPRASSSSTASTSPARQTGRQRLGAPRDPRDQPVAELRARWRSARPTSSSRSPMDVESPCGSTCPRASRAAIAAAGEASSRARRQAELHDDCALEDSTVIIDKTLDLPIMRVPQAQYAAFAGFCRAVDVAEAKEMVVKLP